MPNLLSRRRVLTPSDPHFASVSLLLQSTNSGSSFRDFSKYARTVTPNAGITNSTAQARFSETSILFSSNDLTITNDLSLQMQGEDFTIEWWYYPLNLTGTKQFVNTETAGASSYAVITSGSNLLYYLSSGGSWNIASGIAMGTLSLNAWHHIALVRAANTFTPYVNGIAGTPTTSTASLATATGGTMLIGRSGLTSERINGHLDQFRITKGVARYRGNFTPLDTAFPRG